MPDGKDKPESPVGDMPAAKQDSPFLMEGETDIFDGMEPGSAPDNSADALAAQYAPSGVMTPNDEAVEEEGETPEADAKPAAAAAAPAVDPAIAQRAAVYGLAVGDLGSDPAAFLDKLDRATTFRAGQQAQPPKPEAAKEEAPAEEEWKQYLAKLEFDENVADEVKGPIEAMNVAYAKQLAAMAAENRVLKQAETGRAQKAVEAEIDAAFNASGRADLFGTGSIDTVADAAKAARVAAFEHAKIMAAGYKATGKEVPAWGKLVEVAIRSQHGAAPAAPAATSNDDKAKRAAEAARDHAGKFIHRAAGHTASSSRASGSRLSTEEVAAKYEREYNRLSRGS